MSRDESKWRLRRTLKRQPRFRPLEKDDLKYLWAAYKKGAFDQFISDDMDVEEFEKYVFSDLLVRFHNIWTLIAGTERGEMPVGLVLGFWPHPDEFNVPFMILDSFVWFPWASKRNRTEAAVNFINDARAEIPMLGFVRPDDMSFFNMIAKHGIVRRVGTSHEIFDGKAAIYETRTPNG